MAANRVSTASKPSAVACCMSSKRRSTTSNRSAINSRWAFRSSSTRTMRSRSCLRSSGPGAIVGSPMRVPPYYPPRRPREGEPARRRRAAEVDPLDEARSVRTSASGSPCRGPPGLSYASASSMIAGTTPRGRSRRSRSGTPPKRRNASIANAPDERCRSRNDSLADSIIRSSSACSEMVPHACLFRKARELG